MEFDSDRRAELEAIRARALARDHFDLVSDDLEASAFPFGTCVRRGRAAVVVVPGEDLAALGGVLLWSDRNEVTALELVVEHHAGIHARRAALLAPDVRVWQIDGAEVSPATEEELAAPPAAPAKIDNLIAIIEEVGAEVIVEDGIVRAELAGLEVGRIVVGPEAAMLEVGVGRFDREAGALLHDGRSTALTLRDVVDRVGVHRRPGAHSHAMNRIGRERWIRHVVLGDPTLVAVTEPVLVEPIPPRASLLENAPAAFVARDGESRVLVVCSAGVDLGLVPAAADLLLCHRPDEVRFVLPDRDVLPHLATLRRRLPVPSRVLGIAPPWVDGPR